MPYKNEEDRIKNSKAYYLKNREKKIQQAKEYYYNNWEKSQSNKKKWAEENKEFLDAYKKDYYKIYNQTERGKEIIRKADKKWRENPENKIKILAREAVRYALRRKKIVKPNKCSICKNVGLVEAHHYKGYSKENQLNIMWLCRKCHTKYENIHKNKKPIKGS